MSGSGAPKKAKYLMISDEVVSSEKVFVETMEVCLLVWVRPLQEVRGGGWGWGWGIIT